MKYFSIVELCSSETAEKKKINNDPPAKVADRLVQLTLCCLDPLREMWKSGITITSGYRCEKLNNAVHGSKTSAHMTGYAADTYPTNGKMAEYQRMVLKWAETASFDQIILEYPQNGLSKWIHLGYKDKSGRQRKQILYTNDGKNYFKVERGSIFYK